MNPPLCDKIMGKEGKGVAIMLVKHLFSTLAGELNGIEKEWPAATGQRKDELYHKLLELRKVSDDILDEWLELEERIVRFQQISGQVMKSEDELDEGETSTSFLEKLLGEVKSMHSAPKNEDLVSYLSLSTATSFRKGQGYFHLFMYPQAIEHFTEVVENEPELDIARLFLAWCQWLNGNTEESHRHFQLVGHTSIQPLFKATAWNAEGCLFAADQKWDQALTFFTKAKEIYPKLKDTYFNQALVLMKLGQMAEAKEIWKVYCTQFEDDWEALLQLAKCHLDCGEEIEAGNVLSAIVRATEDPEVLGQVGQRFEDLRLFANASFCYRLILRDDPTNAQAWHGAGWNLWHAEGSYGGIGMIKKAITLSPKNSDFYFSYGWVLYHLKQYERAEQVFLSILQREGSYPLALGGLIHVCIATERWDQADQYCQQLLAMDYKPFKSLGYLQKGKLAFAKRDYKEAENNFLLSMKESKEMKEAVLMYGLTRYLSGNREEAQEIWKGTFSV
jgi:tetratricopeptide (TPR) repeat protein